MLPDGTEPQPDPDRASSSRSRRTIAVLALSLVAAVLAAAAGGFGIRGPADPSPAPAAGGSQPAAQPERAVDPAHTEPARIRTLAVHTGDEPAPSAHARRMRALLIGGTLPRGVVHATVMTDEDCAPDARGVSHCRNRLRLPGGRTITVRHPHDMARVPCMTPGETVRVGPAAKT